MGQSNRSMRQKEHGKRHTTLTRKDTNENLLGTCRQTHKLNDRRRHKHSEVWSAQRTQKNRARRKALNGKTGKAARVVAIRRCACGRTRTHFTPKQNGKTQQG
ncbi:hypothetical protein TRVL_06910 [Trypanosoma vivax]|nr:hypothetical protein TRVL_06910 [Trypanosoma vivax]